MYPFVVYCLGVACKGGNGRRKKGGKCEVSCNLESKLENEYACTSCEVNLGSEVVSR